MILPVEFEPSGNRRILRLQKRDLRRRRHDANVRHTPRRLPMTRGNHGDVRQIGAAAVSDRRDEHVCPDEFQVGKRFRIHPARHGAEVNGRSVRRNTGCAIEDRVEQSRVPCVGEKAVASGRALSSAVSSRNATLGCRDYAAAHAALRCFDRLDSHDADTMPVPTSAAL